jgi:ABC-type Mn2+/Zn2+ transport system permease subunit
MDKMEILSLFREDFFYLSLGQIILFLVVGVPVGYLLVHKNLGLFSDSLSHSLIPGIAGAIFFSVLTHAQSA